LHFKLTKKVDAMQEIEYTRLRREMVEQQLKRRGIHTPDVLEAFLTVRRHIFVPEDLRYRSYENRPIHIGFDQTISQPYITAFMTEQLQPSKGLRTLEIGTGSGYQTAILSRLCKEVYSVEMITALAINSKRILEEEGYHNIHIKVGDGYRGWKEFAPYDLIIVTCAPENIPSILKEQLAENGKMIIPVGESGKQKLYLLEKINGQINQLELLPVLFVPMVHKKE